MSLDAVYITAGPDVVFEEFDGDLVVLNLTTGRYFGFNQAAGVIWRAMMESATPNEILASVAEHPVLNAEVMGGFVNRLVEFELLVVDPDGTSRTLESETVELLVAVAEVPTVESYDDLADLMVVDPIHDTDQAVGWPQTKQDG
ncbi:hypothetical protein BOW53_14545 [Solemya pervernicosa gill symbiont]|uniref:PqqD family protein n=2 Tax=Gammaproteobacteria incertae sedis TaxID=118884 RepID=A0A1T2L0V4_9GAMM|nr:PqqD family protein [Candidatus Reidiella endopervernicosa]OOZ38737.1 hypothetical protein BOW53_14545 [Solemya pervernicosa gill symbiont]QKQ25856.1 PqqD family protein [Candidatus Reidiella endopervernicosa]